MDLSLALSRIFPLTFSLFKEEESQELMTEFSRDWDLDQLHFFPMFLKQKKMRPEILEVANYEYLKWWLQDSDFSSKSPKAPLVLNPTLQIVQISKSSGVLNKKPGLHALWKAGSAVMELKLSQEQAEILDRMQEDPILLRSELNARQIQILNELIELRIVSENLSQTELNS